MTTSSHPSYSSTFSSGSEGSRRRTSGTSILSNITTASTVTSQSVATKFFSPTLSTFPTSSTFREYQIEHIDTDATWYRKYFIHKQHPTFVGNVEPYGPVIISLVLDNKTINKNRDEVYWYRYILRHKDLPDDRGVMVGPPAPTPLSEPPWDVLLKRISRDLIQPRLTKLITTIELSEQLISLDENRLQKFYKIGVLYCAPSQTTEEEWFSNTSTSKAFSDFLDLLGTKVRLLGFKGFSGGLDTSIDGTGEYSIHDNETFREYELMYHVSTMLPCEKSSKHQITRKRHIGNDIVCIIFQDKPQPFSPFSIRSQFLHVYVIVNPVEFQERGIIKNGYRVEIVCKNGVPYFGPSLPDPPIFEDPIILRKFLVATVINGQNAAWKTPKLSEPFRRARGGIIRDIVNKSVSHLDMEDLLTPPQSPKKLSQDELNNTLKGLFADQLKCKGKPPDILIVKDLLEKGANPNIRIPQPKPSKETCILSNENPDSYFSVTTTTTTTTSSSSSSSLPLSSSFRSQYSLFKLPNILFATIALTDDPIYIKFLINYGVETMPKDSHFPNAFVFAATYKRVETMRCLLENIPALSDPESVDTAINDTYNSAYSRSIQNNGYNGYNTTYGNRIWYSFARFKNQIRGR
ncbi:hypothetical protein C1645_872992 [Glomus cerebriforme]|uniref:Rap-GAP domain-containing protein n=1 Tax=Glomus cerebriforme TaxID=658196 RepID=A0A397TA54_9GLOM|nr:hypothetical protein C1645_872992 [Glomus cerebriforme]